MIYMGGLDRGHQRPGDIGKARRGRARCGPRRGAAASRAPPEGQDGGDQSRRGCARKPYYIIVYEIIV